MAKLFWKQAALNDLEHIADYIAEDAPDRAAAFVSVLIQKAQFLSKNPRVGELKLPSYPAVRVFPYKNYLLIFKSLDTEKGIEMLRVMHGARDYLNSFADEF